MIIITETKLIAIVNPNESNNRSWLYNVFFKRITKKPTYKEEKKVNWILSATDKDIERLKKRGCKVITLSSNNSIKPENTNKDTLENCRKMKNGFVILYELFEKFMREDNTFRNNVKNNLTKDKYDKIILAKLSKNMVI